MRLATLATLLAALLATGLATGCSRARPASPSATDAGPPAAATAGPASHIAPTWKRPEKCKPDVACDAGAR